MELWHETVTENEFTMEMVPDSLKDLAHVVGIPAFLSICRHFAGGVIIVPLHREKRKTPYTDFELIEKIGETAYHEYHRCLGSASVYFPILEKLFTPVRDQRILRDYHKGMTYLQVAQRYGITIVTVKSIIKRMSCRHRHHATTK